MESKLSNFLKSPVKSPPTKKPQPSDQISTKTPQKLPHPPQRFKYHRSSSNPLPEKYEMLLKFFDSLDASLKLLRLRKSIPVFKKIRVMIESMSERRFTHKHLAQLKFLLPEEIEIRKVLMADEETRCMKFDLHLALNALRMARADKRKRGIEHPSLRNHLISKLLEFLRDHPEGTEIPVGKLPDPFNPQKPDLLSNTFTPSCSSPRKQKYSGVTVELETAGASHIPPSFRKHFSKGGSDNKSRKNRQNPSESSHQLPLMPVLNPSVDRALSPSIALRPEAASSGCPTGQIKHKPLEDGVFSDAQRKQGTPIKPAGTPIKPATPLLQTPKRYRSSADDQVSNWQSCARSLQFEGPLRYVHIKLQADDADCSNITDILPENILQSLKEKEKQYVEMEKRKQLIKSLPKLFDRIYILFQNPKSSAIRKEALIRNLTECHMDITDENEVEEQVNLLQEIIPEWIVRKFSPSGNILYSINKALNPNNLRETLDKAM